MSENENIITTVDESAEALMELDYDNVLSLADRADRLVGALNKIMQAAIKITTPKDWVLIGGTPYLQETGASKVARLFGIGWANCPGYPTCERDKDGYPTYTYRMTFTMGAQRIEAEGMRSASDEFFSGKGKKKSVDEIDLADVKRAAYTNCLNRGIKAILPGLRNLDVADLENAGINLNKTGGYSFREGTQGGRTQAEKAADFTCSRCGAAISQKVASFSQGKYGKPLCMKCQKIADVEGLDDEELPFPTEAVEDIGGGR